MKEVMVHIYRKIKQISSPFFRSCCLVTFKKSRGHLPLVTSGYYQYGRSLISSFSWSSKMAAMSNSHPGEGTLSQFPVGSPPPPPPPTLGLNIDRYITELAFRYIFSPQIERKRSEEYLVINLAVERKL